MYVCQNVQDAIDRLLEAADLAVIDQALIDHITDCPNCQALIDARMQQLGAAFAVAAEQAQALSHSSVQTRIDELIDLAALDQQLALRRYPAEWLHLLGCAECAEVYTDTKQLVAHIEIAAAPATAPQPLQHTPSAQAPSGLLSAARQTIARWSRELLNAWFSDLRLQLETARDLEQAPAHRLPNQQLSEDYAFSVQIRVISSAEINISVSMQPIISGMLVLSIGAQQFHSLIDQHGNANFGTVPAQLLTDPDGPPLELHLATDEPFAP